MIKLDALVKTYGQIKALDGLSLSVEDGELFAFLGPNGAGKTTAIRILNGLTAMTSGHVEINGLDSMKHPLAVKRLCGLVSQHINLDGELTVAENLEIHGRLYGMEKSFRLKRQKELLEYVEMADRSDSFIKTLSGGQKRRIMIARSLLHQPRLLFLDEPTAGLDPAIRRRIWGLIKKVCKDGVTVFLTTHYIEEAEFLASRVAFIHHGRLVCQGSPDEIMSTLGNWAVDRFDGSRIETKYFQTREEASQPVVDGRLQFTVRRVNLEDAFLSLTGERVRQ
jgi:ABC-2 type transport system ATP-binding protein